MVALPARRLAAVPAPVIAELGGLVAENPGCLSLGQGMVSWGPPPVVAELLALASSNDMALHRYGPVQGDGALLQALQRQLIQNNGLDLEGSSLLITAGSNMAFNAVIQVLCDPGDEVILPVPYYFNHAMAVQLSGGVPVAVEAGLVPDPDQLAAAISDRTRAIVTVSPNNPSGTVIPAEVLAAINQLCARRGLLHISDEAYEHFTYGGAVHWSPGAGSGSGAHTVTLQSLSKSHGMAGWRLGWLVAPQALAADLAKVQDTILICPPQIVQRAASAALSAGSDWCRQQVAALEPRRQQLLAAFQHPDAPWRLLGEPQGAFYGLLELDAPIDADTAMRRLVREHGVAVVSGSSFGLAGCRLRLSYGMLAAGELDEALRRLQTGLAVLSG
ncbi:MAG: aminotransferase class I/II-fold pyridoxal phosphate-dependent enzyme [Prochlorococcaceae cyanobacterium]